MATSIVRRGVVTAIAAVCVCGLLACSDATGPRFPDGDDDPQKDKDNDSNAMIWDHPDDSTPFRGLTLV